MIDGALRLPLVMRGKIELSATRRRLDADHPALGVDDRHAGRRGGPRRAVPQGW